MRQRIRQFWWLPLLAFLTLAGVLPQCATPKIDIGTRFVTEVKPTLEYYCIECHTDRSASKYGGFSLETGRSARITGRHSPVIIPGNPEASLLFHVLRFGHEDPLAMPPAPDKISDEQLEAIRAWIVAGAQWPDGPEGHLSLPR